MPPRRAPKRPPPAVPKAAHFAVKQFFALLRAKRANTKMLAEAAGINVSSIYSWKQRSPRIDNIEACLNALGYKLIAVPKEESFHGRKHTVDCQVPTCRFRGDGGA